MRGIGVLGISMVMVCLQCGVAGAAGPGKFEPLVTDGAWAPLFGEHPRLLGPRERLVKRRQTRGECYEACKANDSLVAEGIVNAVEGIDKERIDGFVAKALEHVKGGVTNEHQDTWIRLTEVAQTYDFFFDSIAPEDRRAMIEWLNGHLGAYTEDENAFHNSTLSKILCYLKVAYATWGENPRAREFRDYAIVKLYEGKVVPVLNKFGAGGGFTECGWYSRHSLWHLVEGLELARRFERYDGFKKAVTFFYDRLAYEMLQPYPGLWTYGSERYACEGDGSLVYGGSNEYPRHMREMLAQYFFGTKMAGYVAAKARPASNSASRIMDFLYQEEPTRANDVKAFPLAHVAEGIGRVYARSDWTDDASWLRFECGDYFTGHQHFEAGNFEIFRYEPLATESGEYTDYLSNHSVNWLIRTIAHNSILVYEPGETWTMLRDGGRHKYANDGGQAKKWEWTVGSVEEWQAKRDSFERGDIIAYEDRPEYMYVAGDCTAAHAATKLESWVRQIVFVRPHSFVIFDRVVSTDPKYEKTWLLHSRNEPEIQGDTFTVKDGKGKLVVRTVLPEGARIESVHGYTYGGQTFDEVKSAQTAAAANWRVEVKPPTPRKEDVFLHVLFTDEPVALRMLRDGDKVGVAFGLTEVLFNDKTGGTVKLGRRKYLLEPKVKKGEYE